ncbi:MAG: cation diffusion facilitator CzcD-associated flavoprotein CzcO [Candidatus Krumholzibacteriia bacterium]|jgi:cation diffusion facilitator CzcD-associated flavoprotein CzcO
MSQDNLASIDQKGLSFLEAQLHQSLEFLLYPGKEWVPQQADVSDVIIIGGGMCGMVAWLGLVTGGVRNIRVLDRSPAGMEGPWVTYARMENLRSPKQLTGPAFGHGALTFQAWYRAQFGQYSWEELDKIPRPMWMDYLRWYRKTLSIPVENEVAVSHVEPEGKQLRLHITGAAEKMILTRKLVFATGRDGTGEPNIPDFVNELPGKLWAHSTDDIDFSALKGKRLAVVGAGASAVDNSAEALEHGAAEVRHLVRRKEMPTINKMMGIGSFGFTCGFSELSDEWRWRFMQYSFATQTPPPHGSTLRVSRHDNAYFHFGKAVTSTRVDGDAIRIGFADGTTYLTDFVILGTGFTIDPMSRSEFGAAASSIQLWKDVYTPPEDEQSRDLGQFPYLNSDFTFREKVPGQAPWLGNVYCFNYGATVSIGKVSGDIPGVSEGAAWLTRDIAARLYVEDVEQHWKGMQNYDTPELLGDEWEPTELTLEGIDA